jgi:hypothetical protein
MVKAFTIKEKRKKFFNFKIFYFYPSQRPATSRRMEAEWTKKLEVLLQQEWLNRHVPL